MAEVKTDSIKIKGQAILHGNVYLSGDPLSSIFYICFALFNEQKARIKNVPRCKLFLDFLSSIERLGISVNWEDESVITVDGTGELRENLVSLFDGSEYGFAQVLIPILLQRNRECEVHPELRTEVKFYRELGVLVKVNYNILNLKLPLDANFDIRKNFNLIHADPYLIASRLFTSYLFNNLSVEYDKHDARFNFYNEIIINEKASDFVEYKVSFSQPEFNLYASIASFSNGEVSLNNFDLSESLNFLLSIDSIGFRYEVMQNAIKIWYVGFDENAIIDWSSHSFNSIAHLILLLAKTTRKTTKIITVSYPNINSLITDLNIMGCRIEAKEGKKGYSLITIKPPSAFSSVKNDVSDLDVGSAVLAFACFYSGNSRISGFEVISEYMPYLIDNLKSLNIDISKK